MASSWTRRDFLRCSTATAMGLSTPRSLLGLLGGGLAAGGAQAASGDYKALVGLFFMGGNDGFNVLVPRDTLRYATYAATRTNLALSQSSILPLMSDLPPVPAAPPLVPYDYGLHPAMPELKSMFRAGRAAFVANVGPLVQPVTKADVQAKRYLPAQLYSHSDQQEQWMAYAANASPRLGWGGRAADLMASANSNPRLSMNISIAGKNLFQLGSSTVPYTLSTSGVTKFQLMSGNAAANRRMSTFRSLLTQASADQAFEAYAGNMTTRSIDLGLEVDAALTAAPTITTVFPTDALGSQLAMVARTIAAREKLGMSRQVFYVSMGGFDLHDSLLEEHPALLASISKGLAAFDAAMTELGLSQSVTTFTASDFGRTLTSNGDGTDHAWGNVHWVTGGAVKGGQVYGSFPNQTYNGPDDAGNGRMSPTTSVDQYGATLLRWFGASESDLDTIFPNLNRFASRGLGFV